MKFHLHLIDLSLLLLLALLSSCSNTTNDDSINDITPSADSNDNDYMFSSYKGLVMTGYQGWFSAEGDEANRGWYHYQKDGEFAPNRSTIDYWPDVSDYTKTYETSFKFSDGKQASVFSSYDEETVDLHFKWMKEYGIDGAFMQRFVAEIKNDKGKHHFDKVLANAIAAARKHGRAISIMYDLSGCSSEDMDVLIKDWKELQATFSLSDTTLNPTYLRHNGNPLLAIWGIGFNDGRRYNLNDIDYLIDELKKNDERSSLMLGVPYYWRTLDKDTENNPLLHSIIKKCDIVLPWAVGRYNETTYDNISGERLSSDLAWCKQNGVDYIPLVFPGFSWGNLQNDPDAYELIPRNRGSFFWKQIAGAKEKGAKSLYVAMFDEIDEGTAIFKCLRDNELPLNGDGRFIGIDSSLESDYYLWLTGEATKWMKGDSNTYGSERPTR